MNKKMGRDKGTNDYSNNFEPQVTGLLDARTRVDAKADLLLASTWTSSDGNAYLPRGIRVSVTNDSIAANNGVYMLMDEDYSVASNWLQIGGADKQDKLISGKNIKTINGQSILGSGNIDISGSGGSSDNIFNIDSTKINFANIKSRVDKNATETEMIYINDYIGVAFLEKKNFNYIDTDEQTGAGCITSVDFSATVSNEDKNKTYLNFSLLNGDTPEIYRLVMDNVSTTPDANRWEVYTQSVKPDLTIDVKTGSDGIYYRIREVVPNGYIQFVRKKKKAYRYAGSAKDRTFHQVTYSPMGLYYTESKVGVKASDLTPNVWYKFPITNTQLVNSFAAGTTNEQGHKRLYNTIKFKGNTHAQPILYSNSNGSTPKRTTVLHAGLQYNVMDLDYLNMASPKVIFKERGEVVPIDARLSVVSLSNYNAGYTLRFTAK